MATFHYQALNRQQQLVVGELEAESVAEALAQLEAQGLVVQSIGYSSTALPAASARVSAASDRAARQRDPVPEMTAGMTIEQAALRSHIQSVLERGKTLVPALRAYAGELPAGWRRRQLDTVLKVLERGDAVEATRALSSLPEYWIPLLSAAAASRDPGRVLSEFLNQSQRAAELRRQTVQTFAYPLLIAGLALAVLTMLSLLVVPVFRDIFLEFELRLPPLTVFVIRLAEWIASGRILIVAAAAVAAGVLLVLASRMLPLPVRVWFGDRFGTPLGRRTALARFTQFCADLLEAGVETTSALRIAGYSTRSGRLQRAAWRLANDIERSDGFAPQPRRHLLTSAVLHALKSDMPTSSRIRLLREFSSCHAERSSTRLSWTRGLAEPIAICVVGGIVGGVVLALFMPLVMLVHGLSG